MAVAGQVSQEGNPEIEISVHKIYWTVLGTDTSRGRKGGRTSKKMGCNVVTTRL